MADPKRLIGLIKDDEFTFSFEVTPHVNIQEIENLQVEPAFFAVTWHAKTHQCKDLQIEPLKIASYLRSKQKQVMLHLSCDMLRKHYLERVLAFLQERGICNLFLMLGEGYDPDSSDFNNTLTLITYIREVTAKFFCIGVAGFCEGNDEKLLNLKEKIDAGADFIITQAIFEPGVFKIFKERCNKIGIHVPIIPGVFAFENYQQLTNFTNMCKIRISEDLLEYAKKNEADPIACIKVIKNLIRTIRSYCPAVDFHFFTLNKLQNVSDIIKEIKNE